MQTRTFVAVLAVLGLLASCAPNPHPMDMSQAVQNAKTSADHEALARHYEDTAKSLQAMAQQQRNMLEKYSSRTDAVGVDTRKEYSQILIRRYEEAAEANMNMAVSHRKMATEAK